MKKGPFKLKNKKVFDFGGEGKLDIKSKKKKNIREWITAGQPTRFGKHGARHGKN